MDDLKFFFYIAIAIIALVSQVYKSIQKSNEEKRQRDRANANRPPMSPSQQPTQQPRNKPEHIPDPWQQTNQQPPVKKQKTIEEILEEMTRQYDKPASVPAPAPKRAPAPILDQLGQPYPTEENPYSSIDKLSTGPGQKGYVFNDSMASSGLTKKDYQNILEEDDVLDKHESLNENFNPREAFKYATLLERKYQ